MPHNPHVIAAEIERAEQVLAGLVGETIESITINSLDASEAPFLGQIVSKLSPMIGNLLEARIVKALSDGAAHGYSWMRQDPGFPDAVLVGPDGMPTGDGYEVKAWYVHSTELTGRFRESVNLLLSRNVRVVVIAWSMSHIVYGTPQILGTFTDSGISFAEARDRHYWQPPQYLTVEPRDTSARTRNLQQSNVAGYRLQETDPSRIASANRDTRAGNWGMAYPYEAATQDWAAQMMGAYSYRLDTNFAKIDRIEHEALEEFKSTVLALQHGDRSVAAWTRLVRDLNTAEGSITHRRAADVIQAIYDEL
ncbi:hypothetical protein [Microbacterium sp. RU33B]|uniref:hypothetical protein n=1 Tax=Microbacterium sp. RU33B TaxID=1907390 RepID=UPI00117E1305|nr:hypothetical protein [Microbacterium sp. RU33B]